jgi:hypothetical protein
VFVRIPVGALTMIVRRKAGGFSYWATVFIFAALVLYPASFGPACWLASRAGDRSALLSTVYRPILMLMSGEAMIHFREIRCDSGSGSSTVKFPERDGFIARYAELLSRQDTHWFYEIETEEYPDRTVVKREGWSWEHLVPD